MSRIFIILNLVFGHNAVRLACMEITNVCKFCVKHDLLLVKHHKYVAGPVPLSLSRTDTQHFESRLLCYQVKTLVYSDNGKVLVCISDVTHVTSLSKDCGAVHVVLLV
jgi:hypothetical protein